MFIAPWIEALGCQHSAGLLRNSLGQCSKNQELLCSLPWLLWKSSSGSRTAVPRFPGGSCGQQGLRPSVLIAEVTAFALQGAAHQPTMAAALAGHTRGTRAAPPAVLAGAAVAGCSPPTSGEVLRAAGAAALSLNAAHSQPPWVSLLLQFLVDGCLFCFFFPSSLKFQIKALCHCKQ